MFTTQLAVRVDGVVSRWVPAEVGDFTALDLAIDLGDRRVAFAAVDAAGLPAPVHLRLGCTDSAAASGLVGAGIDAELPASGRTFGPLPRLPMTGEAVYADGLRVPLALAADATELVVERGATATLRVRVTRAGAPFRGMHVFALRWNGEGPAPLEDERFGAQSVEYHEKTGDDGVAELTVPPGDYLVNGNALLGPAAAVRVRVGREGTATELVVK